MSVTESQERHGAGATPAEQNPDPDALAKLARRLAEARESGEPAPAELERVVSMLAERDAASRDDRLTKALEGLARWASAEKAPSDEAQEPSRAEPAPPVAAAPAARPAATRGAEAVRSDFDARLSDFARSLGGKPGRTVAPAPRRSPETARSAPVATEPAVSAEPPVPTEPVVSPEPPAPKAEHAPAFPEAPAAGPAPEPVAAPAVDPIAGSAAPVASLRSALAEIAARQKALDGDAESSVPQPPQPVAPPAARAPEAPSENLAAIREIRSEIRRLESAVMALPTRSEVDGLGREMAKLAGKLAEDRPTRLDPDSIRTIEGLVSSVERTRGDTASPAVIVRLADALDSANARLDELAPSNASAIEALARQVADIRAELDGFPRFGAIEELGSDIRTLVARLEAQERVAAATRDAVTGLTGKVGSLGGKVDWVADAATALTGKVALLDCKVDAIAEDAGAIGGAIAAIDARMDGVAESTAGLNGRLASIDGKIDAARTRDAELARACAELRADLGSAARSEEVAGLAERVETVDERLRAVVDGVQAHAGQPAAISNIARKVDDIGGKLTSIEAATRPELFDALGRQIEALTEGLIASRSHPAVSHDALIARIDGLSDRIVGVAPETLARAEAVERVEDAVRAVAEHLASGRAASGSAEMTAGLEHRVSRIVEGLERNDGRLDDLNAAFAGVASRIEKSCADLGATVERAGKNGGDGDLAGELAAALAEMRTAAAQNERRTAETIEAVRATLEKLVERIEENGRSAAPLALLAPVQAPAAAPAAETPDAARAARAAARRALEEAVAEIAPKREDASTEAKRFEPVAELAGDHPIEPGSAHAQLRSEFSSNATAAQTAASFIAAARRAQMQVAAADGAADAKADEPQAAQPRLPRAAPSSGIGGSLSGLKGKKRPLIVGLAAAVLVLAALYVASGITGGEPEPAPAPQSELAPSSGSDAAAAPAEPRAAAAAEPADKPAAHADAPRAESPPAAPAAEAKKPDLPAAAPRADAAPAPAGGAPKIAAEIVPPRAPAPDLTPLALASPDAAAKPFDAPIVTGSVSKGTDALPDAIGGPTLRTRAAAGDAAAQLEIADRFLEGRGVAADPAVAARWLEKAAAQGLAPAQHRLGSLNEKGRGVPKNLPEARRWYELAAASGNVRAMHNLGVLHAEGGLGKPDFGAAVVWFRMAAERGLVDSQYNLAVLLARGLGVKRDLMDAYKWFALANGQGDQDAGAKRDEVGKMLGGSLAKAKEAAESFRPRPIDQAANDAPVPPGGWDVAAGPDEAAAAQTR